MTTAITKAKINLPTDINAEMAEEMAQLSKRLLAPTGDRVVVTAQKTFRFPDNTEIDNEFPAVIVDFVCANYYYTETYDRNNVTPAACFALGLEPAIMTPSPNAPDRQANTCASCWANAFGSAGKGKACSNTRLLAILPTDADVNTSLVIMKVSPTAIKAFDGHVAAMARKYGVPVRHVITKISFSEDAWASLRFSEVELASEDLVVIADSHKAEARIRLLTEPDTTPRVESKITEPKSRRPGVPPRK